MFPYSRRVTNGCVRSTVRPTPNQAQWNIGFPTTHLDTATICTFIRLAKYFVPLLPVICPMILVVLLSSMQEAEEQTLFGCTATKGANNLVAGDCVSLVNTQ